MHTNCMWSPRVVGKAELPTVSIHMQKRKCATKFHWIIKYFSGITEHRQTCSSSMFYTNNVESNCVSYTKFHSKRMLLNEFIKRWKLEIYARIIHEVWCALIRVQIKNRRSWQVRPACFPVPLCTFVLYVYCTFCLIVIIIFTVNSNVTCV